jgi:hypothetical protein
MAVDPATHDEAYPSCVNALLMNLDRFRFRSLSEASGLIPDHCGAMLHIRLQVCSERRPDEDRGR